MASVRPTIAAGLIIYRRFQNEIQYLMLQTSYGEHHWTPPKGHVDPGESELEAALRETLEESGLAPEKLTIIDGFRKTLNYEVKQKPKRVVYWLCELKDPNTPIKLSEEHQSFSWAKVEEACKLSGYTDFQEMLRFADKFIHQPS